MSLERDEKTDVAAAQAVTLAGREFYVLPLTLRQIIAIADDIPKLASKPGDLLTAELLRAVANVVWIGLSRAHPKLAREEFLDLEIPLAELVTASNAVVLQAGGKKTDAAAGEQVAASDSTQSTGASSSPNS